MKIIHLGGADTVTGSCHLIRVHVTVWGHILICE